jgi:hypothetical protein
MEISPLQYCLFVVFFGLRLVHASNLGADQREIGGFCNSVNVSYQSVSKETYLLNLRVATGDP